MGDADRLTTERFGIPSIMLMENAARAVADAAEAKTGCLKGRTVSVICGKGNNGGDGAAAARLMWQRGANVRAFVFGRIEETKGDARTNFEIARSLSGNKSEAEGSLDLAEVSDGEEWVEGVIHELKRSDVLIDALFGTGLSRPVEGVPGELIKLLESRGRDARPFIVSVDLPSGLDADRPDPIGPHIDADLTVTFTAPKLANVSPPASASNGGLIVAEIGTPSELVKECGSGIFVSEDRDAVRWLEATRFTETSYKKTRGTLLLVVGSRRYSGAAVLAANGAMESGVGMVTVAAPKSAAAAISERVAPEVIVAGVDETVSGTIALSALEDIALLAGSADAIGIGCGLGGEEDSTRELVRELVAARRVPMVVDADGLNAIAPLEMKGDAVVPLILTPHPGEFRRLTGAEEGIGAEGRLEAARSFALENGVILVMKGTGVIVASPKGESVIISTGNSGLGKAGNGDNLTGILAGFTAQAAAMGVPFFETAVAACHLSGIAGDIARIEYGRRSMLASDVRRALPEAVRTVLEGREPGVPWD